MTGRATDLPVLLPAAPALRVPAAGIGKLRLRFRHGAWLALALLAASATASAQGGPAGYSAWAALGKWTPLLLQGFGLNILMSVLAMAIGTAVGALLGLCQISLLPPVRFSSWLATQFFRNAPWLVLLFYCMLLLPFELQVGGRIIPLPAWVKATFGLALPVMANVSELVRGAIQSIPYGQWEAAESLAFARRQTLWMIILPQCLKRMLPPWMNLYAILTMGTSLTSVVGVNEALTLANDALSAEANYRLLVPMYLYVLLLFFLYCWPIARWTVALERRFAVKL